LYICGESKSPTSVSYTHLDVYKRQVYHLEFYGEQMKDYVPNNLYVYAVSYTHLDVYLLV
ncbi:hypothetical protein, partial [Enterococcus faecium]|uniref:hypothetical protein n=1 Tax=Enterococcus faecium TaxID=1352 RepID=UPI001C4EE940